MCQIFYSLTYTFFSLRFLTLLGNEFGKTDDTFTWSFDICFHWYIQYESVQVKRCVLNDLKWDRNPVPNVALNKSRVISSCYLPLVGDCSDQPAILDHARRAVVNTTPQHTYPLTNPISMRQSGY